MSVTPADVLKFKEPTSGYLCPVNANTFGIEFVAFKIRDMDSKQVLFDVSRDPADMPQPGVVTPPPEIEDDSVRFIRYDFHSDFLRLRTIGTTLTFCVGPKEVSNFRMIERHYFKRKLIKSFDFTFGFCIPNSTNTWETIYTLPKLSEAEIKAIVDNPYETRSDSFYFVGDELIMHNKAEYAYVE
eukprot:TRINITY_DN13147_c0_g1_i1.p1 TRINITY_DN13147_c0_g1~~TRINITY_DN13147_c0_g1_i1.p1  ORF type:complete len:185 (-),score=36.73 TRINITY_DN13147_c0_g1_i1:372-926(-)